MRPGTRWKKLCGNLPPVRQALQILAGCHAAGVGSARCYFASGNN